MRTINEVRCDFCDKRVTTFIDGATTVGYWADMCKDCHKSFGKGIGTGKGQMFELDADYSSSGMMTKIEG